MVAAGYFLAVLMGLTLGLLGAGGSLLTVPILVYLFGVPPVTATGYSLVVVGAAAFVGAFRYSREGRVNLRAATIFSIPAMVTVLFTRRYLIPAIPDPLGAMPKDSAIMLFFAGLMVIVAFFMLRPQHATSRLDAPVAITPAHAALLVSGSAGVGLITGSVGAGGGFLIVPTLMTLFGLPVKEAIGTSLAVIAVNALMGFNGDLAAGIPLNWPLLIGFLAATLCGMAMGTRLGRRMDGARLKRIFGLFTLCIGLGILIRELLRLAMQP